jgi:hypothetical protein
MAINPAFLGHGIFLELAPIKGLRRYANYKTPLQNPTTPQLVEKFLRAVTDMNMSSVWFELFTRTGEIDTDGKQGTRELLDGLKGTEIRAVPWGYCFGKNSEHKKPDEDKNDLALVKRLCDKYTLDLFVADIEPWNESPKGVFDEWNADALKNLVTGLNEHFEKDNLGLSSFANIDDNIQGQSHKLLPPLAPLFSFCAPQIYWNSGDPVGWAKRSLQSWRNAGVTTELVATVQSYWSAHDNTPSQADMEGKVTDFVNNFPDSEWSKIVGLNWYHAGGKNDDQEGGMSNRMIGDIAAGQLDGKPYKKV